MRYELQQQRLHLGALQQVRMAHDNVSRLLIQRLQHLLHPLPAICHAASSVQPSIHTAPARKALKRISCGIFPSILLSHGILNVLEDILALQSVHVPCCSVTS